MPGPSQNPTASCVPHPPVLSVLTVWLSPTSSLPRKSETEAAVDKSGLNCTPGTAFFQILVPAFGLGRAVCPTQGTWLVLPYLSPFHILECLFSNHYLGLLCPAAQSMPAPGYRGFSFKLALPR